LERRERGAIKLMVHHLQHVFDDLMLEDSCNGGVDLKAVLGNRQ
jgi:hypothetical protein